MERRSEGPVFSIISRNSFLFIILPVNEGLVKNILYELIDNFF
jgi:hypothetical protein